MRNLNRYLLAVALAGGFLGLTAAPAQAQLNQNQDVAARILPDFALTVQTAFTAATWDLTNGVDNDNQTQPNTQIALRADSNVQYTIRQNCDLAGKAAGAENRLTEGTGAGAYIASPAVLALPLRIARVGTGVTPVSTNPTGVLMPGSSAQAPTAAAGAIHNVLLQQQVNFGDTSVSAPNNYYITLTFTIVAGAV